MKIDKDFTSKILFLICIVVSLIPNYELTFAIWFITFLVTINKNYSVTIFKYVATFSAILLIAFLSSLFYQPKLFLFIRDITYMIKPIIGLLLGYQIFKNEKTLRLNYFIYVGLIIAIIHIGTIFIAFLQVKSLNLTLLREKGGYFSDYEIYVIIMLIFHKELDITISKKRINYILIVVVLSSTLYAARTNMIQFVILFLAMKGYFKLTRKSLTVLVTIFSLTAVSYFAIVSYNPKRGGKGLDAFLYKIKIAPEEAFKTKINKNDWKDFNDNYRSFENIITVQQVSHEGALAILFGEGLGSRLNLGRKVFTNDGEFVQFIPYVHNGFMTVFFKSGILGVLFLIFFLILLFRQPKTNNPKLLYINYLLIGTSVFLIVSNWVFLGLYLKLDNKSIIIGFLIALKEVIAKQSNTNLIEK
ncbi:hypothetical protein [Flavobacterium sp.]|uniref:hypothetical protein n=1 Tax=Flavobacterium sp. TaxID=239 RepID=UPI00333EDED3